MPLVLKRCALVGWRLACAYKLENLVTVRSSVSIFE